MVISVAGSRLDAQFLRPNANVDDYFTILKDRSETTRPLLRINTAAEKKRVLWPRTTTPYNLESTTNLAGQISWRPVTNAVSALGRRNAIEVDATEKQRAFRLRR